MIKLTCLVFPSSTKSSPPLVPKNIFLPSGENLAVTNADFFLTTSTSLSLPFPPPPSERGGEADPEAEDSATSSGVKTSKISCRAEEEGRRSMRKAWLVERVTRTICLQGSKGGQW